MLNKHSEHSDNSGLACDVEPFVPRLKLPCSTHTSQSHSPPPSDRTSALRKVSISCCSDLRHCQTSLEVPSRRRGDFELTERLTLQQLLQPPMSYAQAAAKGPKQSPEEVRIMIQNLDHSSRGSLYTNRGPGVSTQHPISLTEKSIR